MRTRRAKSMQNKQEKGNNKVRVDVNETENRRMIEKIMEAKK